jgi:hypothetical protein
MPSVTMQRIEGQYAPTAAVTTNLARLVPIRPGAGMTVAGKRIAFFSCRVQVAGTTTAAVSFGTTSGGVSAIATVGEVAATVLGRKTTFAQADMAGNGVLKTPGAAEDFLTGTYTIGAVNPVIHWCIVLINDDVVDDLFVA